MEVKDKPPATRAPIGFVLPRNNNSRAPTSAENPIADAHLIVLVREKIALFHSTLVEETLAKMMVSDGILSTSALLKKFILTTTHFMHALRKARISILLETPSGTSQHLALLKECLINLMRDSSLFHWGPAVIILFVNNLISAAPALALRMIQDPHRLFGLASEWFDHQVLLQNGLVRIY
jgi:hypothetical protein